MISSPKLFYSPARYGFLFVFLLSVSFLSGQYQKYYLTEFDFISDYPVALSEVGNLPYLLVEYDRGGLVNVKTWYDSEKLSLQKEKFIYSSDSRLLSKKYLYDRNGTVIQETTYGGDALATKFVEFSYGIDLSTGWDDRFTIKYFSRNLIDSCKFHDASGRGYGIIKYGYDNGNQLISEKWVDLVEGTVIRQWKIYFDSASRIRREVEIDRLGHVIGDTRMRDDGYEDAFIFLVPERMERINSLKISYRIYSALGSGRITLAWGGGEADPMKIHSYSLYGVDLEKGDHELNLGDIALLADKAWYAMSFDGTTCTGNPAIPKSVDSLFVDSVPPLISLRFVQGGLIPEIAFSASEKLTKAELIFLEGNEATHKVNLTENELFIQDSLFIPENSVRLDSNTTYSAFIRGRDEGGNWSNSPILRGIRFDTVIPLLTIISPAEGNHINSPSVILSADEPLASITASWTRMYGSDSVEYTVSPDDPGNFTNNSDTVSFNAVTLADSTVYNLNIMAVDLSGNQSGWIEIKNVTCDLSEPIITSIFPTGDTVVRQKTVSYIFSEDLQSAEYEWTPVSGPDSLETHIVVLKGEELTSGKKIQMDLLDAPDLLPGSTYDVRLTGRDKAGNEGQETILRNVKYEPFGTY